MQWRNGGRAQGARASARFNVRMGMTLEIMASVLCDRTVKRRERRAPANDFMGVVPATAGLADFRLARRDEGAMGKEGWPSAKVRLQPLNCFYLAGKTAAAR